MKATDKIQEMRAGWIKLIKAHGRLSFEIATAAYGLWDVACQKDDVKFGVFMRTHFGENRAEASHYLSLAKCLSVAPDRETWVMLGERGVRALAKSVKADKRGDFVADAKREAKATGLLSGTALEKLATKHSRSVSSTVKPDNIDELRVEKPHPAVERDVLIAEFARILRRHPEIMDELSDDAKKVLDAVIKIVRRASRGMAGAAR